MFNEKVALPFTSSIRYHTFICNVFHSLIAISMVGSWLRLAEDQK